MNKYVLLVISLIISPLILKAQPIADFSIDEAEGCAPLQVQFTDASTDAITWNWVINGTTVETVQNPNLTLDAGIYEVCLTVTDAIGQSDEECKTDFITVYPSPEITGNVSTEPACFGSTDGEIDIMVTGGSPPYTFLWTNGVATEDVNNLPTGVYAVTVTDINGCTGTGEYLVTEPTILNVSMTGVDVLCNGNNDGSIDLTVAGGTTPYAYDWSPIAAQTEDLTGLAAGTYTVTITDANNCTVVSNYEIVEAPTIEITLATTCATPGAADGTIIPTVTGGVPPYLYTWSNGQTNPDVTDGLVGFTYEVTITDANSCTAQASHSFNDIIISLIDTFNCDDNVILGLDAPGAISYNWEPANLLDDPTSVAPTATITEPTTFSVTVTNAEGCEDVASVEAEVPDGIYIYPYSVDPTCGNANGYISLSDQCGGGDFTYQWNPNVSTTNTASGLTSGIYDVTVTNDQNNTETFNFELVDRDLEVTIPGPSTLCIGGSLFLCRSIINAPPGATYTYQWSGTGDFTGDSTNPCISFPNATMNNTGCYSVTVTDESGCTATAEHCLEIVESGVIEITASGATYCEGDQVPLNVTASGAVNYSWSNGNLSCYDCPNPIADVSLANPTFYTVTVTNAEGCQDIAFVDFNVQSYLDFNLLTFSNSPVLAGESIEFDCNVPDAISVTWSGPDGFSANDCNPIIDNATSSNTGIYTVDIADQYGCTASVSPEVNVYELITSISDDIYLCEGFIAQLEVITSTPTTVSWSPTTGLDDPMSLTPLANPATTTTYTVTVSDGAGTVEQISVLVEVAPFIDFGITNPGNICPDEVVSICAVNQGSGTHEWIRPDGLIISDSCILIDNTFPSGCYTFTYVSLENCLYEEVICFDVTNEIITNLEADDMPECLTETVGLTVTAPNAITYEWTPADVLSCSDCPNPTATLERFNTFFSVTVTDANGCTDVETINIDVDYGCVWPGDTDSTFVVNNFDLLNIGLAYGTTGPTRPNATLDWLPQPGDYWSQNAPDGTNYKHIDTDGNGIINSDDTLAITQNWGEIHNLTGGWDTEFTTTDPLSNASVVDAPFYVEPDTFVESESYALPIILGEEEDQLENIYGLAFSLEYDETVIVAGSAGVGFDGWIGALNDDMIAIQKTFVGPGRIDVGLTRIDGAPMNGFGQMGLLYITIEDDVLFRGDNESRDDAGIELKFDITNVLAIGIDGEPILITPTETISIVEGTVSTQEIDWDLYVDVLPNPVDDILFVNPKSISLDQLALYSISGERLIEIESTDQKVEINTKDLAPGMYLLKARTPLGLMVRKVLVAR